MCSSLFCNQQQYLVEATCCMCCLNAADSIPSFLQKPDNSKILIASFGAVLGFLIFGLVVMYRIFFRQGNVLSS